MSSFVCDSIHFNSIERGLQNLFQKDDFYPSGLEKYGLRTYSYESTEEINARLTEIVNKWRELNVISFFYQYQDHYKNIDEEIQAGLTEANTRDRVKWLTNMELYVALNGLEYQIEFERLKGIRDDLKVYYDCLNDIINLLAKYICKHLPEYEKSQWAIFDNDKHGEQF